MENRIYSFLGLAVKAGKLLSGDDTCERAIRSGRADLVIIAEDASDNTRKKFESIGSTKGIELKSFGRKELLGRYTGKGIRSVLVITEKQFAKHIGEMIDSFASENGGEQFGKNQSL